ncbi:DNA-methyltransferase [Carnobacterium jeotgali]|uniref:DNA-methyltransferase n=1 Tax=Carnobacterium jeotgali TaxID=545534 RepID=UPI000551448A|nr:site-specific DNA-methyltransferase [Carnobacterium jeotgali]
MEIKKNVLNLIKEKLDLNIDERILDSIVLDMTRVADKKITILINELKKEHNFNVSTVEKEQLRKYLIGYPIKDYDKFSQYRSYILKDESILVSAYNLIENGLVRNNNSVLGSITARYKNFTGETIKDENDKYLQYIKTKQINENQLILLHLKASAVDNPLEDVCSFIKETYTTLSNYHNLAIYLEDDETTFSWSLISKIAIFAEQFLNESDFSVYNKKNKERRIDELSKFLDNNNNIDKASLSTLKELIADYYQDVSYGFQFNDLYISENGAKKVLIFQKIELDEDPIPCPACMIESGRGNSYPKLLYKSFECSNPNCPARSKIGRGKRYDYFGTKRSLLLWENDKKNKIDDLLRKQFRRDIFSEDSNVISMILKFYSWNKENVLYVKNDKIDEFSSYGRNIVVEKFNKYVTKESNLFEDLKIFKLFKEISRNIKVKMNESEKLEYQEIDNSFIYHGNSSNIIPYLPIKIDTAVTSPPYYNAREYSQWETLYCYLIDMMINASSVYKKIEEEGKYFYNIGDIVSQDNIFIKSNMSKRRTILGFYSVLIFELVGFEVEGNIIWDKGEVQSKRNSSSNKFSGYVKPINCYEHIFVFSKSKLKNKNISYTKVKRIDTVKKINSKGTNILGHTAPYPEEIVDIALNFTKEENYILDPFLGSGTTVIAAKIRHKKAVGIEMDDKYFELAVKRINEVMAF